MSIWLLTLTGCFGSRPCENALNTSKVESYGRCLRNQQTEARIALVSYIGVRKCCLGRVSGPNSHSRTIKRLDSRPDRLKQSCDAENAHHSFEVVGEHMKAHFGAYPW
ncbi:hypothetical protein SAMN04489801_4345 [Pseudomonas mandelii]|uniref:Lipoprotein n=1 Tax=Pseudomonas mandelii TaxID=75612 RepID=A0ABY0VTV2_9PSED|nr:hypothetical protein SAMN04489801_4345 [Pseudomonas mandelii]